MILTHDNYFTPENKYLSNSKVSDWLKDKEYFYKKHITGEIASPVSDAMVIGSATDDWLTLSKTAFDRNYTVVTRRSRLKSETPWRYQLTNTMYTLIENMCTNAEASPALKQLRDEKYIAQEILQADLDLTHFEGLCGIPDWYRIDSGLCTVVDLKTAQSADPTKYHYKCLDLGYYRQAAFYQILLQKKYKVTDFESRHLVIEKDPDGINHVRTFVLDQDRIEDEKENLFKIFEDIKKEQDFHRATATWEDAIRIGEVYETL